MVNKPMVFSSVDVFEQLNQMDSLIIFEKVKFVLKNS